MKRIREKGFSVVLMLFALLWVSLFPACLVQAENSNGKKVTKKNDNFQLEAEYGIDGFLTYNDPTQVKITVESKKDFTGTIRVIPEMDSFQKKIAYGEEISLAGGEAKTFTFVLSCIGNSGKVQIELLDEKDHVTYAETRQLTVSSVGTSVMVGILSDDYSGLNYFDGIPLIINSYQGLSSTLELTEDSFPAESQALSVLNYIILDNFDTAKLSDDQYTALKEWVNDGGVLILALGSNYQNVLNKFDDDFITGTLGSIEKKELVWGFSSAEDSAAQEEEEPDGDEDENKAAYENKESLSDVDVIDFTLDDGVELTAFSSDRTAYQKNIGAGRVVVLSYALGMEPFAGYENNSAVAGVLLYTSAVDATEEHLNGANYNYNIYRGINLAKIADVNKRPSALLYGVLLFFYVVLVGPVLYLVLKAVGKREKIWLAVPIVALVFTGIIYATSFIYRVNKPLVNTFSMISLEGDSKQEKIYTNITCPKAKTYTVKIKDEYSGFQYDVDDYSYSLFDQGNNSSGFDYMIKKSGNGNEIILNNQKAFDESSFMVGRTGKNDIGTIDCDLKCYTTGFEGTITNNTNYDLKGVVVTFENHFYQAGDIKQGEQVTVDTSKIVDSVGYGVFEQLYQGKNINADRETYKEYYIDSTMENSFIDIKAYGTGYVWGKVGSYKPDMIDGTDVKQSGIGVLFNTYTAEYADVQGGYYPSIEPMVMSSQGEYDSTDGSMYNGAVTVSYSFEGYSGITMLQKASKDSDLSYGKYADIYALNPETGDYDLLFAGSDTLSGNELKKYMVDNIIVLKYEPGAGDTSYFVPRIAARGEE